MSVECNLHPVTYVNILILGDYSVGKTTTIRHIIGDKTKRPMEVYCPMSVTTTLTRNGTEVKVKITDTGGKLTFLSAYKNQQYYGNGLYSCSLSSSLHFSISLRKHAYSNILKISPPKNENFQIKISDIFLFSAQNLDCGYPLEPPHRGGSNEYPQSMFLSRNKKNKVYPCKPQFYNIKVGFKGVKII